ncbi:Arc family DNA-binding protein [Acinetobacter cumulans]|uniref:Arc family DNA-binding protein n=1 Tax=Acinetobacter cumulans TaxID=2136182 RepID=A0ABX9U5F6_9GAMM|nr:Arc family DNA-binding protein [Acinetobacter cumulans]RLL43002.1 Arc family DNA-binding protein [Acinetobacter cumulans]
MSENQKEPQYKLRWSEELRDKVVESAKLHSRSINAEICTRLEQSFSQNQNDFNAGYNACMVHMVIATSKALTEKGIPWSDVQKTLIEVVDDFHKIANEKKAP